MDTDYIIVGQGICGTLLSYLLMKAGKKVMVIDEANPFSAGRVASGLINPVTGMRVVQSWMIDELLPVANTLYTELEQELGISIIMPYNLLEFHTTPQQRDTYKERYQQSPYLHEFPDETQFEPYFNFHFGISEIAPCSIIDMRTLQTKWREQLSNSNSLIEEKFDWSQCSTTSEKVTYKNYTATKLICCEGSAGLEHPYFSLLPFALNKGEVLIVDIPELPRNHIFKSSLKITPWEDGLFWVGSSFDWKYDNLLPSEAFRNRAEHQLKGWLKTSFKIIDHWASTRPATVDHKPFVGFHPLHPSIGILNGMGAKGCSQAPYFALDLAQHLTQGTPLFAETAIQRFTKILSRIPD